MIRQALQAHNRGWRKNERGVCTVLIAVMAFSVWAEENNGAAAPSLRLGKRLFVEKQFTNPASNFAASCRSCHLPEWAPEGKRAYSDSLRYSLIPTNSGGRKLTTLRNVPTLMDVAGFERFNHDGRFTSLKDAIAAEFVSPHMGWLPEEREWALNQIQAALLYDAGVDEIAEGTYIEQFKRVYAIDLEAMTRDEAVGWVVTCLAEYVASLKSTRTSAYDAFAYMNRVRPGPAEGESLESFGYSMLGRFANLEGRGLVKIHAGFGAEAYAGFKIFMRTSGDAGTGNCVACHVPPLFTDGDFHNTGVAQAEYDAARGGGSFAQLAVPEAADAVRPVEEFGPKLENREQVNADLGYWNSVERREGVEGGSFLAASTGAFKTPTLRNLTYTDPYMHNGAYGTLEEAIAQKVKACALAKSGALRNGDGALSVMNITEEDIAPLAAFLATLNDLSVEEFEEHRRSARSLVDFDPDQ